MLRQIGLAASTLAIGAAVVVACSRGDDTPRPAQTFVVGSSETCIAVASPSTMEIPCPVGTQYVTITAPIPSFNTTATYVVGNSDSCVEYVYPPVDEPPTREPCPTGPQYTTLIEEPTE